MWRRIVAYSSKLGRWAQQDPAGYVDGVNVYEALLSSPTTNLDAHGLQAGAIGGSAIQTIGGPNGVGTPTTQSSAQKREQDRCIWPDRTPGIDLERLMPTTRPFSDLWLPEQQPTATVDRGIDGALRDAGNRCVEAFLYLVKELFKDFPEGWDNPSKTINALPNSPGGTGYPKPQNDIKDYDGPKSPGYSK
jgi:hypothetical protein